MKPTPVRELAQSDPKELEAIEAAIRAGRPTYWIQASSGCTYDVLVDEKAALKAWDGYINQVSDGIFNVKLYKRIGTAFHPYPQNRKMN